MKQTQMLTIGLIIILIVFFIVLYNSRRERKFNAEQKAEQAKEDVEGDHLTDKGLMS